MSKTFRSFTCDGFAKVRCSAKGNGRKVTSSIPEPPTLSRSLSICAILPEPLQSSRSVLRNRGDCRAGSRHVLSRIRDCSTRTRAQWWPYRDDGDLERPSRGGHIASRSLQAPYRLSVALLHQNRRPAVLRN